jgi:hypothetical protein
MDAKQEGKKNSAPVFQSMGENKMLCNSKSKQKLF